MTKEQAVGDEKDAGVAKHRRAAKLLGGDASALSKLNSWRLLKLIKIKSARSRLYRSRFLQVNTRWKALAEIYTMHSFAPLWNPLAKNGEKGPGQNNPEKEEN